MAVTAVVVKGGVTAKGGSTPPEGISGGKWEAGPVSETPHGAIVVAGAKALSKASCLFTYTGGSTPNGSPAPPFPAPTLTLSAAATTLRAAAGGVLRHGDSAKDSYGNELKAESTQVLRSA